MPSPDDMIPLDFETLLADPMTRLLMARDGVSEAEMRALLERTAAARALPPVADETPPG
jgi:hypothetical protein